MQNKRFVQTDIKFRIKNVGNIEIMLIHLIFYIFIYLFILNPFIYFPNWATEHLTWLLIKVCNILFRPYIMSVT
jgi:hypothetical protein